MGFVSTPHIVLMVQCLVRVDTSKCTASLQPKAWSDINSLHT